MGEQESATPCRGLGGTGLHREPETGWTFAASPGFQPASQPQDSEGTSHPDRNAQFEHINMLVNAFQAAGQPAISVDTKKKELVGDFKNNGRELRPRGQPEPVRVHDFAIPELGKVSPYGVYGHLEKFASTTRPQ
jgi:hypothetical protein